MHSCSQMQWPESCEENINYKIKSSNRFSCRICAKLINCTFHRLSLFERFHTQKKIIVLHNCKFFRTKNAIKEMLKKASTESGCRAIKLKYQQNIFAEWNWQATILYQQKKNTRKNGKNSINGRICIDGSRKTVIWNFNLTVCINFKFLWPKSNC